LRIQVFVRNRFYAMRLELQLPTTDCGIWQRRSWFANPLCCSNTFFFFAKWLCVSTRHIFHREGGNCLDKLTWIQIRELLRTCFYFISFRKILTT
jgi:hypothetical protein